MDLSVPVQRLGSRVQAWTRQEDWAMHRVFSYLRRFPALGSLSRFGKDAVLGKVRAGVKEQCERAGAAACALVLPREREGTAEYEARIAACRLRELEPRIHSERIA